MATRKKGLGRGLEALLGPSTSTTEAARAEGSPSELRLAEMVAGQYQPRTRMDEGALYELAESIKAQGIMQPILVRKLAKGQHAGKYEIIAGERRFRAAHLAGLTQVPVLVRDVDDHATAAMALIENMQREDLNPLEEAQGLQRLIREFGLTHEQAAQAIGRSRSATSNLLRLLNLADPVQTMLLAGDEFGNSQAGNNNGYCQDNATTWLDWPQRDSILEDYVQQLIALRREIPLLHEDEWWDGRVHWLTADGLEMHKHWEDRDSKALQVLIDKQWLLLVNAKRSEQIFHLPPGKWNIRLAPSQDYEHRHPECRVDHMGIWIFYKKT